MPSPCPPPDINLCQLPDVIERVISSGAMGSSNKSDLTPTELCFLAVHLIQAGFGCALVQRRVQFGHAFQGMAPVEMARLPGSLVSGADRKSNRIWLFGLKIDGLLFDIQGNCGWDNIATEFVKKLPEFEFKDWISEEVDIKNTPILNHGFDAEFLEIIKIQMALEQRGLICQSLGNTQTSPNTDEIDAYEQVTDIEAKTKTRGVKKL